MGKSTRQWMFSRMLLLDILILVLHVGAISNRNLVSIGQRATHDKHGSFDFPPQSTLDCKGITDVGKNILELRGGAKRNTRKARGKTASLYTATGQKKVQASKKESKSALNQTFSKYKSILPLTRIYITLVGVTTLIGVVLGDEMAGALLALDPIRTVYGMELWRPLTAATFLGPPSIGWLMNAYSLFEYGSSLERAYGTAQHVMFLLTELVVLTLSSMIFGLPFFTSSMITAMLHVLSRSMPDQKVKWLIFTVPYWTLPYGLMISDVLQSQNPAAALPHVLGILAGHVYFFHKFVWPKQDRGEDWLTAPAFLSRRLDPDARVDKSREVLNKSIRRKKGKGRRLGSS